MEKYQSDWLTSTQMEEVNEFQLDKVSCKNHIPNEVFLMFGHKIEIHYMDGRVEKKKGWYSKKRFLNSGLMMMLNMWTYYSRTYNLVCSAGPLPSARSNNAVFSARSAHSKIEATR